ncbi:hypothetical protein FS842_004801 [Serendipita sp. 407]|nr:hypothetical protein FS842_004801 [Serendipita sp. 407]
MLSRIPATISATSMLRIWGYFHENHSTSIVRNLAEPDSYSRRWERRGGEPFQSFGKGQTRAPFWRGNEAVNACLASA